MLHKEATTGGATKADYAPYVAMLTACLLWGSGYIAMKYALISFPPITVIFFRMSVASAFCLLLVPLVKVRVCYKPGDWKWLLVMILCEPCLYFIFESHALTMTSASQAGMLIAAMPVFVGLGGWLILGEKLSRVAWVGCIIAVLGVIWLNIGAVADEHAPRPILGNSLELIAMLFASGYAICVRRVAQNYSPIFITAIQAWGGFLFFLPLMFTPYAWIPENAPVEAWAGIVYLGLGMSFAAYSLYNFSLKRLPAAKASIYLNLIPVFTLILSFAILGERMTQTQYLACVTVMCGVIISQRR